MPRDDRLYIHVHEGMPEHPKVEALSDAGFRALVDLWCWCSRNKTDGHVPAAVWTKRAKARIRKELLSAGLAHQDGDGVRMHDYLKHQRSRAEIEALTADRREKAAKGNHERWHVKRGLVDAECLWCQDMPNQSPTPSREGSSNDRPSDPRRDRSASPDPDPALIPEPDGSGAPPRLHVERRCDLTARDLVGEWIDHCPERPTKRVIGMIAREVGALLDEGIPYDDVRGGLQLWQSKVGLHPSTLSSVVHEFRMRRHQSPATGRPSTAEQRVAHIDELRTRMLGNPPTHADEPAQLEIGASS